MAVTDKLSQEQLDKLLLAVEKWREWAGAEGGCPHHTDYAAYCRACEWDENVNEALWWASAPLEKPSTVASTVAGDHNGM